MRHPQRIWPAAVFGIVCALLLAATALGAATADAPSDSPEAERLRAAELSRLRALVSADMAAVESLTAPDFELVPPPGIPLSRAEYLGAVSAGAIDYLSFEPRSEMKVRLHGQAAAVRYLAHINVVVSGLGHFDQDVWVTEFFERHNGRWQIVWEQATGVGGFPLPSA